MKSHFYAVIMAGGGGTRLWPLSRKSSPKQMLKLFGERTLFQIAVDRLDGIFPPDHIFVVTVADQAEALQKEVPEIPAGNYLIEPMPRGTASVVAMAAAVLHKRDPESVMAVLTADHFIQNIKGFQQILLSAAKIGQQDYLVTLGIPPTFAATGYGYIERGEELTGAEPEDAYRVLAFKEKPDEETAKKFLSSGRYSWNSGMFVWKTRVILDEFKAYMPDLFHTIQTLDKDLGVDHSTPDFNRNWGEIHPETIDYGIMERSARTAVLLAGELGWNDVGSWDSIFDVLPGDEDGNIILNANAIDLNTQGTLICSNQPDRLVVALGMKDVIIVDTKDAVLVCPRYESQRVKDLVAFLKSNHYTPFL